MYPFDNSLHHQLRFLTRVNVQVCFGWQHVLNLLLRGVLFNRPHPRLGTVFALLETTNPLLLINGKEHQSRFERRDKLAEAAQDFLVPDSFDNQRLSGLPSPMRQYFAAEAIGLSC